MWSQKDVKKARLYKTEHYWGRGGRKKRKKKAN
jgi:hypothetical protein